MAFVLQLHDIWRWVLLVAVLVVVIKALVGWLGKRPFTKPDSVSLAWLSSRSVDIQVLLGLIIWLFGPMGLQTLSQSMGNGGLCVSSCSNTHLYADRAGVRAHSDGRGARKRLMIQPSIVFLSFSICSALSSSR